MLARAMYFKCFVSSSFFYQKSEDICLPSHDYQVRSDLTTVSILCEEYIRGLLEKYPTFGREKETGLLGALNT